MAKNVKFYDGHTVQEWEKKYQKQIAKGKIKVFEHEQDLLEYAKYWKIDGKYYQIPMVFEWYAKSLRKSKGLTIALTATSTLATFFLIAALVQSQIKFEEDRGCVVSLYAGDGVFTDLSKSKIIHGVKRGTKLKEIKNYIEEYIPSKPSSGTEDYGFDKWYVDDGKDETVFLEDDVINTNISLKANYEMVPSKPDNFKTDSWATVYSVIEEGKDYFIDTYCNSYPSYDPDPGQVEKREDALLEFMDSLDNWKIVNVGNVGNYGVRLIGVGQDELYTPEPTNEDSRELFTFEFNECLQQISYSYEQGGSPFYTAAGAVDPEYAHGNDYCYLKTYYDSDLFYQLPEFIQKRVKSVRKRTLQIHDGFSYTNEDEKGLGWVFNPKCLTGEDTESPNRILEMVETEEKLFSLSLDEIGGNTIDFKTGHVEDPSGKALLDQSIQANEDLMKSVGIEKAGEGFLKDGKYRGAYMFYQNEWESEEGEKHTDELKRMKRYFVGDDSPKGINTQYRLRSIYIPNEYDTYEETRASGNKDYSPFETWNINPDGDIGNYKLSGKRKPDAPDQRYHFMCGDMAWAGIYVAPAFCL